MDFNIQVDDRQIKRFLRGMPRDIPKAMASALNKTMQRTQTYTVQQMGKEKDNAFKAGEMKRGMWLRRATYSRLTASLTVKGGKGTMKSVYKGSNVKQTATGVKFKPRAGPAKIITGSFIATMKSGHVGVFKRRGAARLKIDEEWMSSVRSMFNRKRITKLRDAFVGKEWPTQVTRAIKDRLRRYNGAGAYIGLTRR